MSNFDGPWRGGPSAGGDAKRSFGGPKKRDEPADNIDDKWSKAFGGKSSQPPSRAPWGDKEPREPRAPWGDREQREPREPREPRAPWGDREPREPREPRAPWGERGGDRDGPRREPREQRGDRGDRGDRGGYDRDNRRRDDRPARGERSDYRSSNYSAVNPERDINAPLPTAPKSASSNKDSENSTVNALFNKFNINDKPKAATAQELEAKRVQDEKAAKAAKKKADEEAKKAAEAAKVEAANEALNKIKSDEQNAKEAVEQGLKGQALTDFLLTKSSVLSAAGVVKAVLNHITDYTAKWYSQDEYGNVLKALGKNEKEQVLVVYAIQTVCHAKKFPKIETKTGSKKLFEYLLTIFLNAQFVEVDSVLAWSDDSNDADIPGKIDALVQTSTLIQALRDAAVEEVEEEDYDDLEDEQAHL